jgi:hypothetical protein
MRQETVNFARDLLSTEFAIACFSILFWAVSQLRWLRQPENQTRLGEVLVMIAIFVRTATLFTYVLHPSAVFATAPRQRMDFITAYWLGNVLVSTAIVLQRHWEEYYEGAWARVAAVVCVGPIWSLVTFPCETKAERGPLVVWRGKLVVAAGLAMTMVACSACPFGSGGGGGGGSTWPYPTTALNACVLTDTIIQYTWMVWVRRAHLDDGELAWFLLRSNVSIALGLL